LSLGISLFLSQNFPHSVITHAKSESNYEDYLPEHFMLNNTLLLYYRPLLRLYNACLIFTYQQGSAKAHQVIIGVF
jgi:hypothetical protein